MSMLCNSTDEPVECPLCMEPLEMDDLSFFPCTCGYQICRFCWHRIRTDENGLCPACRKAYPENPADFKPLSTEELARIKAEKRQKDQQKKQKVTESRKHLANVRVVQKNLVFVVGLSSKLADPEVLKRHEYFGKFGKIHKVVINHSTQYAGNQGPSASAYVTYVRGEDALRAIQAVNNITVEGKTIRASLGTTKYCSHFMKNQSCPKPDCMYLHEIGDDAASFTKEEMQQGRHTDYERSLHEQLLYLVPLNKENRKPSSSPPLTQNLPTLPSNSPPGNGSREAWPTLCTSVPGSSSSSSTSGSTTSLNVPSNLSGKGTSKVEPKEKSRHKKSEDKLRKIKEKGGGGATPVQPASSTTTTLPNSGTRPRSSSGSPPSDSASSSNHSSPPPPLDNGYSLSSPTSLSLAAEEEEVDRLRDAAETRSTSKGSQPSEVSTGTSEAEEGDYRKFFNSNASTDQDTWQGGESSTSGSQTWRSNANPDTDEPPSSQKDTSDNSSFFKNGDDDLGFDPFHETQKALAEMLEKEKSSASSNHATHNSTNSYSFASPPNPPPSSHMFFNSLHQHALSGANQGQQQQQQHQQQQQAPQLFGQPRPGLYDPSSLASGTSSLSLGIGSSMMPPSVVQRNRVPPPGFNPPAHNTGLGFSGLSRPMSQSDLGSSKILPFISSANQPQSSNFTSSMENSLPGRFFAENSGLGGASLGLGLTHLGLLGQTANRHANHNPLSSYGGTLGSGVGLNYSSNNSGYGLGHEAKNEMGTGHKDWQDSLHSLFPNSNFGNISGGANLRHPNNLCNPQLQTQNAPNKTEWRNSFTDWTALDPAIVSSGHPTDSRSDSPPHWLRYLEQLTESNSSFDSYNASSVAPRQQPPQQQPPQRQPTHPMSYQDLGFGQNNSSCALPPAFSRLEALNSLSNAWPPQVGLHAGLATATPTPPPGFSHLRPGKAAEAQKLLDNM